MINVAEQYRAGQFTAQSIEGRIINVVVLHEKPPKDVGK
jgi:hypothetical protein